MELWERRLNKLIRIIVKYWRPTIGSLTIIISVYLLVFKVITTESLAAIVAAMVAAGYIPKSKSSNDE